MTAESFRRSSATAAVELRCYGHNAARSRTSASTCAPPCDRAARDLGDHSSLPRSDAAYCDSVNPERRKCRLTNASSRVVAKCFPKRASRSKVTAASMRTQRTVAMSYLGPNRNETPPPSEDAPAIALVENVRLPATFHGCEVGYGVRHEHIRFTQRTISDHRRRHRDAVNRLRMGQRCGE